MPGKGVHRNRRIEKTRANYWNILEGDKVVGGVEIHSWLHKGVPDSFTHHYGKGSEVWVPPQADLLRRLKKEGTFKTGKPSPTTKLFLSKLSIPSLGFSDSQFARNLFGLPSPWNKQVTREEIAKSVRGFFPKRAILGYIAGEDVDLPRRERFRIAHKRQFMAAWRRYGGLDNILKEMEHPYSTLPEVLYALTNSKPYIPRIAVQLRKKFYSGAAILPITLKHSRHESDRKLSAELFGHAKAGLLSGKDASEKTIADLLGISEEPITYAYDAPKYAGKLGEEFVRLSMVWAEIFKGQGVRFPYLSNEGAIRFNEHALEIDYVRDAENCIADARKGNQAIEVKLIQQTLSKTKTNKIIDVYSPGKHFWKTGEPIDSSLLVLDMQPHLYDLHLRRVAESEIAVIGFSDVHDCLSRVFHLLSRYRSSYLPDLKPRVDHLGTLVGAHRELVLNPSVLLAKPNELRREWIYQAVRNIRVIGEKVYNETGGEG